MLRYSMNRCGRGSTVNSRHLVGEVFQEAPGGRGVAKRAALQNALDATLYDEASPDRSIVMISSRPLFARRCYPGGTMVDFQGLEDATGLLTGARPRHGYRWRNRSYPLSASRKDRSETPFFVTFGLLLVSAVEGQQAGARRR